MRILFQCNTVYQLMTALQIKNKFYNNDICDFLISDIMNDCDKLLNNLKQTNLVHKSYIQYIKNIKINRINKIFFRFTSLKKYIVCNDIYNNFYNIIIFSNPSINNINLFQYFRRKNKNIVLKFYEDGLSTYSKHYEDIFLCNKNKLKNYLFKNNILKKSNELYVFENSFFMWKPTQKITIIPKFKRDYMLEKYNLIFNYDSNILPKNCKIIFFEEGYFADGKKVNDLEIIEKCVNYFGNDGFYVKIHPRNPINRFKNKSIKCIPTSSIPWELIVLNNIERIENMILITIASASIFTTNYLFNIKPKSYSCLNLINDKNYIYKNISDVEREMMKQYDNIKYIETIDLLKRK